MSNAAPATTAVAPDPAALERAIIDIAAGMRKLAASRLRRETIVLLVSNASGVGKRDVERVIGGLEQLERTYLKPAPQPVMR